MGIRDYFSKHWKPVPISDRERTGPKLISKIGAAGLILDVGCGYNEYKEYFGDRLTGIDPYNSAADIECSIEDYETNKKFDYIFCLGSINFGSYDVIRKQVLKVGSLCTKDTVIFWRQNPGIQHENFHAEGIEFFKWDIRSNLKLAKEIGFKVTFLGFEKDRLYVEWRKIQN